jgi:hypothetical protein
MTRISVPAKAVFLATSAIVAFGGAVPARPARAAPGGRPNLLFLLSDDQRWDTMGCAGNPVIRMPEMDALAREGVRFRNAFVTSPICAARRASLFTGTYERTHRSTFKTPPCWTALRPRTNELRDRYGGPYVPHPAPAG